ncbi:alpha/beta hydrolase [Sorangium sp. So ce1335]|uniref:alpha/beta hydrolase n=1 Tax=Sorangium sp. So ce1335 TaxID=3133335 RepID=UPI003F6394A2
MTSRRARFLSAWRALALASLAVLAGCDRRAAPCANSAASGSAPASQAARPAPTVQVEYIEVVTGGADPAEALPLVVAIHGLGDRPESFAGLLSGADFKARLIVPRGFSASHGGYSWFPVQSTITSDFVGRGILTAADALAALLDRLVAERPTRGKPIVTGFSQGGALTFALALHHPRVVGAAFPLSGWVPPSVLPCGSLDPATPALVALHGQVDGSVPIGPTRDVIDALRERGARASLRAYPDVDHKLGADMKRDLAQLVRGAIDEAR